LTLRRFFLVRLGWALLGLWLAVTAAFLTFSFAEVDVPGRGAEERARIRDQLYLDEPIHERYGHFLRRLVTDQSTGRALSGRDSGEIALEAIPATASLVVPGLILALLLAWAVALLWVRAGPRKRLLWRFPGYVAIGSLPFWAGLWLSYYLGSTRRRTAVPAAPRSGRSISCCPGSSSASSSQRSMHVSFVCW
jgi:ABC-type dipeptide/oligopeptide/nickel transport system permease component